MRRRSALLAHEYLGTLDVRSGISVARRRQRSAQLGDPRPADPPAEWCSAHDFSGEPRLRIVVGDEHDHGGVARHHALADGPAVAGVQRDDALGRNAGAACVFVASGAVRLADLEGSGAVGVKDLMVVLASWGGGGGDVNGDGSTDVTDSSCLLAA